MKTQRILGAAWLAIFSSILILWYWQLLQDSYPYEDWHWRALASPVLLFGAVAGFFLFQGARWARIALGMMTLLMAVLVFREIRQMGFWPRFDGYLGIVAIISAVILLYPRRHHGSKPVSRANAA
ncbi:MAG: hypothetical protein ABSE48_19795 [Verrucomicrobiota bacterium]|jgi:hypothetical protein